jgi:hypothetical protein
MYTDMFDHGAGGGSSGRRAGRNSRNDTAASNDIETIVVRFKAGQIDLSIDNDADTTTTAASTVASKFRCVAKPARGEVRLVKSTTSSNESTTYFWQWYDRTLNSVQETTNLLGTTGDTNGFERIILPNKKIHELDRVYVWTNIRKDENQVPVYKMYWMQDADASKDEEIVASVNQYFEEVATAIVTAAATSSSSASQVDALSSILENLGMPQTASASSLDAAGNGVEPLSSSTNSSSTTTTVRNQLTLADLQGAMASVHQQLPSSTATVGPSLQDVVSLSAIDAIMDNPDACQRLIQYLPPEQQSMEYLRENLTSSSMQSTLRVLTQMLLPNNDDGNLYSGYSNLIANFQLNAADGESALLLEQNPVQAFLNCIIASVEKDNSEIVKLEENRDDKDDDKMNEDKDDDNIDDL